MSGKARYALLPFLFICMLSACSKRYEEVEQPAVEAEYDWKKNGFTTQGSDTETVWYATGYRSIGEEASLESLGYHVVWMPDGLLWVEINGDDQISFFRPGFDGDTAAVTIAPREEWGIEEPEIFHVSALESGQMVFFAADGVWQYRDPEWARHFYVVYTDAEGRLEKKTDILPVLKEKRICEESGFVTGNIECDSEGNLYLWDRSTWDVYLLNVEGEYVKSFHFTNCDGKRGTVKCFKTDKGEVIVAGGQAQEWEFVWLDARPEGRNMICTAEIPNITEWYGMWGNHIYCNMDGRLTDWDISNGGKSCLFDITAGAANLADTFFWPAADGGLFLAADTSEKFLLKLSAQEPEKPESLCVANLCQKEGYLQNLIASFEREHMEYHVDYQDDSADAEKINRILMETANGKGPDILYLSYADMCNLWEKSALGDLNQLMEEETLAVIYPAALEIGGMGERLAGIPLYTHMGTLWITERYWQKESWNTEELLDIIENHAELTGIFSDRGVERYDINLRYFMGENLLDSPYIQNGRANFDTAEFRRILSCIKEKTSARQTTETADDYDALQNGRRLGTYRRLLNLSNYHNYLEWIGPDAHVAGLPSETGRKIPLYINGIIVVNQNAVEKPGIREFINYLFAFESQRKCFRDGMSIRSDMMERCIDFDDYSKSYGYRLYDGSRFILTKEADGPPRVEEYDALWRDAVFIGDSSEELFQMIIEEANPYFYSDKDMDSVIDSMTRRVQLYLDERK